MVSRQGNHAFFCVPEAMATGMVHVGHLNAVRRFSTGVPLSGDIFRPASVIPLVEPLAAFVYLCALFGMFMQVVCRWSISSDSGQETMAFCKFFVYRQSVKMHDIICCFG